MMWANKNIDKVKTDITQISQRMKILFTLLHTNSFLALKLNFCNIIMYLLFIILSGVLWGWPPTPNHSTKLVFVAMTTARSCPHASSTICCHSNQLLNILKQWDIWNILFDDQYCYIYTITMVTYGFTFIDMSCLCNKQKDHNFMREFWLLPWQSHQMCLPWQWTVTVSRRRVWRGERISWRIQK